MLKIGNTIDEKLNSIRHFVPSNDIYMQLAEEASELAQAAIKMCRVGNNRNPTPISDDEANKKLIEEYTDVLNVAQRVLGLEPDWIVGDAKIDRWCKRLFEKKGEV